MRIVGRTAAFPLVRTTLLSPGGLTVAGVLGVAFVFQRLRSSRRKAVLAAVPKQPGERRASAGDDFQDWTSSQGPTQLHQPSGDKIVLLDEELPLSCKAVWKLIYDYGFVQGFHNHIGNTECKIGKWSKAGSHLTRKAEYIKPLKKNAFGPREAFTAEEYRCLSRGEEGFRVDVNAYTRHVPYGGSFHVEMHWTAICSSAGKTRLHVVGGIVFEKRVLVAGIIKKATLEGLRETYDAYKEYLWRDAVSGKQMRGAGSPPPNMQKTLRSVSTATRVAAEDLIRNGVFVSWGAIGRALLFCWLFVILLRLSWKRQGRLLSFDVWPEWSG